MANTALQGVGWEREPWGGWGVTPPPSPPGSWVLVVQRTWRVLPGSPVIMAPSRPANGQCHPSWPRVVSQDALHRTFGIPPCVPGHAGPFRPTSYSPAVALAPGLTILHGSPEADLFPPRCSPSQHTTSTCGSPGALHLGPPPLMSLLCSTQHTHLVLWPFRRSWGSCSGRQGGCGCLSLASLSHPSPAPALSSPSLQHRPRIH